MDGLAVYFADFSAPETPPPQDVFCINQALDYGPCQYKIHDDSHLSPNASSRRSIKPSAGSNTKLLVTSLSHTYSRAYAAAAFTTKYFPRLHHTWFYYRRRSTQFSLQQSAGDRLV
jgi:hypothetical protein